MSARASSIGPSQTRRLESVGSNPASISSVWKCSSEARSNAPLSREATRPPRADGGHTRYALDLVALLVASVRNREALSAIILAEDLAPERGRLASRRL